MNEITSIEILQTIFAGDIGKFQTYIELGLDVNRKTECDGWNFLHRPLASLTRAPIPSMIEYLIKLGVDVNARDRHGWTPLHFAARIMNVDIIKLLLDAGAEIDPVNDEGLTPLRITLEHLPLNKEATQLLLLRGANKYHEVKGNTVKKLAEAMAHGENAWLKDLFE